MDKGKELAEAHWEYVESIINMHEKDESIVDMVEHHYITAFIHGYKHGHADGSCNNKEKEECKVDTPILCG